METLYLLVVGSRNFNDYGLLSGTLDPLTKNGNVVIISGGAKGADYLAKVYAEAHSIPFVEFPAQWDVYGKRAGYLRNKQMHEYVSQFPKRLVVAFWDGQSKGTAHSFELAEQYGNPIKVVRY